MLVSIMSCNFGTIESTDLSIGSIFSIGRKGNSIKIIRPIFVSRASVVDRRRVASCRVVLNDGVALINEVDFSDFVGDSLCHSVNINKNIQMIAKTDPLR